MYPELITFSLPDFLHGIFSATLTIYWYSFLIAIGAILALSYTGYQAKKQYQLRFEDVNILFLLLLLASIIGGKVFYFFEDPDY